MKNDRHYIATSDAPRAIGPYSQAVAIGGLVFCSGQIALDPASGTLVSDQVETQAHQVFRNLSAVLEAAGSSLQKAVKVTVFLKDLKHFDVVNKIYAEHFGENRPARSTVEVSHLPKDALIEVDIIATS